MSSHSHPFRVVLQPEAVDEVSAPPAGDEVDLSLEDIEAAYLRALETADLAADNAELPEPPAPAPDINERSLAAATSLAPATASPDSVDEPSHEEFLQPARVLEAFLFVGEAPLPAQRLAELLGGRHVPEQIDSLVDTLNVQYQEQGRPYEIALLEGGYRLRLRDEFEPVRRRVYGQGPREVKLNQEALEVLALIAYRQPASREQLAEADKPNVAAIVRQLLRRELIALHRDDEQQERFRTTARFLELFGLRSLRDLPTPLDFQFK